MGSITRYEAPVSAMEHELELARKRHNVKDNAFMLLQYLGLAMVILSLPFEPNRVNIPSAEFMMMIFLVASGATLFFVMLFYRHVMGNGRFKKEIRRGQHAMKRGSFGEARASLLNALGIKSTEPAWASLAITLALAGQYKEAIDAFVALKRNFPFGMQALRRLDADLPGSDTIPRGEQRVPVGNIIDSTDPDALPFLANVALHIDDIQGAKQLMSRYLTVQPNDIVALKLWAAGLYERGEHVMAAPVLARIINLEPSSKEAWILLVSNLIDLKDVASAEPALERARAARIDEVEYWNLRTDVLSLKGDLEGALASLEHARELGLNDHVYWEDRIALLTAKKDLERALDATREARTRFPRENAMLFKEFDLDMQLKRFDDAIMLMEDARKENPGDVLLLARLGFALGESGNLDRADLVTASALDLMTRGALNGGPRDPFVAWARGNVLIKRDAIEPAMSVFLDNLKAFPDHRPSKNGLVACLLEKEDFQAAIPLLEQLLASMPDNIATLNNLAISFDHTKNAGRAREYYQKGLDIEPDNLTILANFGEHYLEKEERDLPKARSLIEKALAINPKYAHGLYSMSKLLVAEGSIDASLDYLAKAISMDPKWAKKALKEDKLRPLAGNPRFEALVGKA